MKSCSNCGKILDDEKKFCPNCGKSLQLVEVVEEAVVDIDNEPDVIERSSLCEKEVKDICNCAQKIIDEYKNAVSSGNSVKIIMPKVFECYEQVEQEFDSINCLSEARSLLLKYSTEQGYIDHLLETNSIYRVKKPELNVDLLSEADTELMNESKTYGENAKKHLQVGAAFLLAGTIVFFLCVIIMEMGNRGNGALTVILVLSLFSLMIGCVYWLQNISNEGKRKQLDKILENRKIEKRKSYELEQEKYIEYSRKKQKIEEAGRNYYSQLRKSYVTEALATKAIERLTQVRNDLFDILPENKLQYKDQILSYFKENRASTMPEALNLLDEYIFREEQLRIERERNQLIDNKNKIAEASRTIVENIEAMQYQFERAMLSAQREAEENRRMEAEQQRRIAEQERQDAQRAREKAESERRYRESMYRDAQKRYDEASMQKRSALHNGSSRDADAAQTRMDRAMAEMLKWK